MRRHRRSLMRACLWLLMASTAVGMGCRREERTHTPDGRVIVDYWEKWTGFEGDAMQAVVDDFNASQDRIFVRFLAVSQIEQKLMLATAGGNPPDVAGLRPFSVETYAERGALIPLNRRLEEAGITRDHYIPSLWDICEHRGYMWGLPSTPATVALHWNKAMFREAGLDPDRPPQSLAELDAIAEKLTIVEVTRDGEPVELSYVELTEQEKADKSFRLIRLGFSPDEPGWWKHMWGYWFGAELWDGESTITATNAENLAAMRWHGGYTQKYGVRNLQQFGESFGEFSTPQNAFLDGRVAMVLQGVWMYNFIDKFAPNLEWGAAPFPAADPEALPGMTIIECDVLAIPKGADHPDEAFEFIRYVNTQAAMEKLCLRQRKFSSLAEVSDDFVSSHPNPYIRVFMELAGSPNARTTPQMSIWSEYRTELDIAADRVFAGLAPPEEALEYVRKRMQWKLDRELKRWNLTGAKRLEQWAKP